MPEAKELKPCPFCGSRADVFQTLNGYHCVQCVVCGCGTMKCREITNAVKAWNRRVKKQ